MKIKLLVFSVACMMAIFIACSSFGGEDSLQVNKQPSAQSSVRKSTLHKRRRLPTSLSCRNAKTGQPILTACSSTWIPIRKHDTYSISKDGSTFVVSRRHSNQAYLYQKRSIPLKNTPNKDDFKGRCACSSGKGVCEAMTIVCDDKITTIFLGCVGNCDSGSCDDVKPPSEDKYKEKLDK